MANEFKHVTVGTEITQAEYESITGHAFDSQARGDIPYASSTTQLSRIAIGGAGAVLTSDGTDPVWDTTWSPTGHLIPASDDSYDLGSASAAWQDLFLEGDISLTDAGTISTAAGALTVGSAAAINITPTAGSAILLDGTISVDAGVVTGATSITSTAFVGGLTGNVTGNASGTAATVTTAAQSAITSLGTLTTLTVDSIIINGTNIGHTSDTDAIAISSGGVVTMNQIPVFSAGINVSGGTIAGTLATAAQANVTSLGTLTALTVDDVSVNGATIGHTSDTDLMTLADGVLTVAGELDATTLDVSGNADIDGTANLDDTDIDGTLVVDGSNISLDSTSTLNIDNSNTSNGVSIATATSGVPVTIGHGTSEVTVGDNLTVTGDLTVSGTQTIVDTVTMNAQNAIIFEGQTANTEETTLTIVDPDADRTIYLPNQSGYIPVLAAETSSAQISTTVAELNLVDGGTARGTTSVASGDGILINDGGTMRMTNVDTVSTYFSSHNVGGGNIVTTGALDSGSITSNFGTINTGSSTITTTGAVATGALTAGGIIKTDDSTNATSTTDGSLQTDGGLSVALDGIFGDDVTLITDSAVLNLGVGSDVSLTHDGTTGGTLSGTPLVVDSLGASALANDTYSGLVLGFIANGTIAIGQAVYVHTTDGRVALARANAVGTMPAIGVAVTGASDGNPIKILVHGIYNDSDGFGGAQDEGDTMYVDDDTAGLVTATIPDADGEFVQVMGMAVGPRDVYINPSLDIIERD